MLRPSIVRVFRKPTIQSIERWRYPALIRPLSSSPRSNLPLLPRPALGLAVRLVAWCPAICPRSQHTRKQYSTTPTSEVHVYEFNDIKAISEQPTTDRIIIDVREPNEYSEGYIPTAINLPIKSQPDALMLPADEFHHRYGFSKPAADQEVVFYCRSGVRSTAATRLAEEAGYQKIGNYKGSWLDWTHNGGEVGR